jgi:Tfp pilus assembly protein PilX
MMHSNPRRKRQELDDAGSAMILTLMVMALVTALATTVAVVTINNLQASSQSRLAGSAVNSADAGIAQAVAYLRNSGVRELRCSPNCASNPWGSEAAPASVAAGGTAGQAYKVWIEPVAPFPAHDPGLYRIHSTGTAAGAASRKVTADVGVTTTNVPKGIFARTINGGGDASVARESIFSTGCVYNRSKITMVPGELDAAYGIPIAVHSSQIITESNGTGQYCPTTNKPIHKTGTTPTDTDPSSACHTSYPYDQDRLGGRLVSSGGCYDVRMEPGGEWGKYYSVYDLTGDGVPDPASKIETDADLFRLFGIRTPVLTQGQIDQMRTLAQSQGNYWTQSQKTHWTSPDEDNAVMFFDLAQTDPGGTVDLNEITGFGRVANLADTDASCPSKSLIIVVEGGNVKLNANQDLFASLFLTSNAPNGQVFKANGTTNFIGSIYADTVNLTGTADLSMDGCFLANTSPALLELTVANYSEDDRGLN